MAERAMYEDPGVDEKSDGRRELGGGFGPWEGRVN